ncbi:MAG: RNA helicase [Synechococcaceae cyanobacterium]|nr:RNA helicase [Synechococcaceae cyanobacterium]
MATTEPGGGRRPARSRDRSSDWNSEPLDQRLDRWVSAGRQLVDGVSGARPGSRSGERRASGRSGGASGAAGLGRWVEEKLDWLLEDGDDWREPWQEPPAEAASERQAVAGQQAMGVPEAGGRRVRRSLEAVSRRGAPAAQATAGPAATEAMDDWPSEDEFRLNRWQRPAAASREPPAVQPPGERTRGGVTSEGGAIPIRPVPRSNRRR